MKIERVPFVTHYKNDLNIFSYFTYLHYHDDTVTRSFLLLYSLILLLYWWRIIYLCCFSYVRVVTFHHLNSFFYAGVVLNAMNVMTIHQFIRRRYHFIFFVLCDGMDRGMKHVSVDCSKRAMDFSSKGGENFVASPNDK